MILTITLNPLLERRLFYKDIRAGAVNRAEKEFFTAGGKGINVNRQLNLLGIPNNAFTFVGGHNGKILRSIIAEEKIDATYCSIKAETRQAALTFEESSQKLTTFFGVNPVVTESEANEFKNKLDKAIQNCSIVVLSGSSPSQSTDSIFPHAISLANKYDKISILDTYGKHLKECIEQAPTIIHNNLEELQNSLETDLSNEEAVIGAMKYLYKKGIRMTFLTNGGSSAYASKFDFHYKILLPGIIEKDPCGSGDSFDAGIAYGLENALVFEDFLKMASALGTANAASFETSRITLEQMKYYYDKIEVLPLGKKMKLIDDSPTI